LIDASSSLAWRSQTRKELVQRRLAAEPSERAKWSTAIDQHLLRMWPDPPGQIIAFCWPYKAEHDARTVIERWISKGATVAMPVVVAPKSPLVFRRWHAGAVMEAGALGIPFPADSEEIRPDTILLPANGFDAPGFRLGYGAGYFDRTIASLRPDVRVIGIAYEIGRLSSIQPQLHDEAMDVVVTEAGVHSCYGRATAT
jgi:5,10-methenyltetrahydrofolate synthetase